MKIILKSCVRCGTITLNGEKLNHNQIALLAKIKCDSVLNKNIPFNLINCGCKDCVSEIGKEAIYSLLLNKEGNYETNNSITV